MAQIFIEVKPADGIENPISNHLYLVYRADDGNEWVIRAGPSGINVFDTPFDFEINVPIADSSDARGRTIRRTFDTSRPRQHPFGVRRKVSGRDLEFNV
jgi:hypothetical protein